MQEAAKIPALAPQAAAGEDPQKDRSFIRHVATLLTGTVSAQVLPLALTPLLTRVFSPAEFGNFALFTSVAGLLGLLVTLRYNYALLLPDDDAKAVDLAAICLILSAIVSGLFALALLPFTDFWVQVFQLSPETGWIQLLPLSTFLTGVNLTLYTLVNRHRKFGMMSLNKVAQSAGAVLAALLLGWLFRWTNTGLIWGYVVGQFFGIAVLLPSLKPFLANTQSHTRDSVLAVAVRYQRFALLGLPGALINGLSNNLPVIFISLYFTEALAGQYNLTFRVVLSPLTLISVAILDVFKERAARDFSVNGSCRPIFLKTAKYLAFFGAPSLIIFYPVAPAAFTAIFGDQWHQAGVFTQALIPFFIGRVIVSPLSYVVFIAEKQGADLIWQTVVLMTTCLSFVIGAARGDLMLALHCFSWTYALMYVIYFILNYHFSVNRQQQNPTATPS